jgi:hypothetical protein
MKQVDRKVSRPEVEFEDLLAADAQLSRFVRNLNKIEERRTIRVRLNPEQVRAEAERLKAIIDDLSSRVPSIRADLNSTRARAKIDELEIKLARLNAVVSNPSVRLQNVKQTELQLIAINRQLRQLDKEGSKLGRLTNVMGGFADAAANAGTKMLTWFGGLGRVAKIVVLITSVLTPLIALLGALGGAAIGAANALSSLSGVAAALPGLFFAAGTGIAALVVALAPLAKVFKAVAKIQEETAAGSEATAETIDRVKSAEAGYANAQRASRRAQEGVNKARAEALKTLQELRVEVSRADLSEEGARAALMQAEDAYRSALVDSTASDADRAEALHNVHQAEADVVDVRAKNAENLANLNKMEKEGIEGSEQVVAAREAATDANVQLANSGRDLQKAQKELAAGSSAAAKAQQDFQIALGKLSPSAQAVVVALVGKDGKGGMVGGFKAITRSTQEAFFAPVVGQMGDLKNLLPTINTLLTDSAGALGRLTARSIELVKAWGASGDLEFLSGENVFITEALGDSLLYVADAFKDIAVAAAPFTRLIVGDIKEGAKAFRDFVKESRESGRLANWLELVYDRTKQWFTIFKNLALVFFNFGKASSDFGTSTLDWLVKVTDKWREFSEAQTLEGSPFKKWLEDIKPTLREAGLLVRAVADAIVDIGADPKNLAAAVDILRTLREDILPGLVDSLNEIGQSGITRQVLDILGDFLTAFAEFWNSGGGGAFTSFLTVFGAFAKAILEVLSWGPIPTLLGYIATGLGAILAVFAVGKLTGFFAMLSGLKWMVANRRNLGSALAFVGTRGIAGSQPIAPRPGAGGWRAGGGVAGAAEAEGGTAAGSRIAAGGATAGESMAAGGATAGESMAAGGAAAATRLGGGAAASAATARAAATGWSATTQLAAARASTTLVAGASQSAAISRTAATGWSATTQAAAARASTTLVAGATTAAEELAAGAGAGALGGAGGAATGAGGAAAGGFFAGLKALGPKIALFFRGLFTGASGVAIGATAGIGIYQGIKKAVSEWDKLLGTPEIKVRLEADKLTKALLNSANRGKLTGDLLGSRDFTGYSQKETDISGSASLSITKAQRALESARPFYDEDADPTSAKNRIKAIEDLDKALEGMVKSGNATQARKVLTELGYSTKQAEELMPGYTKALDQLTNSQKEANKASAEAARTASRTQQFKSLDKVLAGLAGAGKLKETNKILKDNNITAKEATDILPQYSKALNNYNKVIEKRSEFEKALADQAAKPESSSAGVGLWRNLENAKKTLADPYLRKILSPEHKARLVVDISDWQAKLAILESDDLLSKLLKGEEVPPAKLAANIEDLDAQIATIKEKLEDPDLTKAQKIKLEADLTTLKKQRDKVNEVLSEEVKAIEIKADTTELDAQIEAAKASLADPNLTHPERAKIEANIDDLLTKKSIAVGELNKIKGRTVALNAAGNLLETLKTAQQQQLALNYLSSHPGATFEEAINWAIGQSSAAVQRIKSTGDYFGGLGKTKTPSVTPAKKTQSEKIIEDAIRGQVGHNAYGGILNEGLSWVGERGPELAHKSGSNVKIVPNNEIPGYYRGTDYPPSFDFGVGGMRSSVAPSISGVGRISSTSSSKTVNRNRTVENLIINNPVPERASDSLNRQMQRLNFYGGDE